MNTGEKKQNESSAGSEKGSGAKASENYKLPKRYSTGSLNFRITAAGFAGMLFAFFFIDVLLIAFDILPLFRGQLIYDFPFSFAFTGDSGAFAKELFNLIKTPKYICLLILENFILAMKIFLGSRSVAHKLEPVEALSDMVMNLNSGSGVFNEDRLKALEDAIDSMDGDDAGLLNTGDKELEGLELAVNGLVKRMHESYMQQARFVSDASHELRTPIAVIKGYADMLDRWGKKDKKILDESVDAIKSESERMSYLVEQLLFLARGDCGKTKLKLEEFSLAEMMQEVFEESKMIDEKHRYILRIKGASGASAPVGDGSSEKIMIRADRTLLKQTARILVDNAAKYTPEGERITLGAETRGSRACFLVQDNGIGIAGSSLPYLFDRFYRADDSRAKNTGGTGLGLAIAKWIVDRHGGGFEILSREGIGTRIVVNLPAKLS